MKYTSSFARAQKLVRYLLVLSLVSGAAGLLLYREGTTGQLVCVLLCAALIVPAMPYLLSFAAGAMVYVVVEELIPEMTQGEHSHIGVMFFATGFTLMMSLDVALG